MEPGHSIGALGFRRWYSRQLLEAHMWLVSSILSAIVGFAALEHASLRKLALEPLGMVLLVMIAGFVCWYSTTRYLVQLIGTQRLAERSVCPSCKAYGLFNVIDERASIGVRCRMCSHEWRLA